MDGFSTDGFFSAVWFAILLALINMFFSAFKSKKTN